MARGCGSSRLARVIVGRGTDAAKAEHHIITGQRALQGFDHQRTIIAEELHPIELEAALGKHLAQLFEMHIATLAAHDLVADDQGTKAAGFYCSHTTTPSLRSSRKRIRQRCTNKSAVQAGARKLTMGICATRALTAPPM